MKNLLSYFFFILFWKSNKRKRDLIRWRASRGDEFLRYAYPLSNDSIVFDVGGFKGDFTYKILQHFGSVVHYFEPLEKYYSFASRRFSGINNVYLNNYGLSASSRQAKFVDLGLGSKINPEGTLSTEESVELVSFLDYCSTNNIVSISLLKINIEGGEYELLRSIIDSGFINNIMYLQIQFHDFVDNASDSRDRLRECLKKTHVCHYNFDFIWESWRLKTPYEFDS